MRNKTVKQKGGNYTELNKDMTSILSWGNDYGDLLYSSNDSSNDSSDDNKCEVKTLIEKLTQKQQKQGVFHKQFGFSFRAIYSEQKLRDMILNVINKIIDCFKSNNLKDNIVDKNTYKDGTKALIHKIDLLYDENLREKVFLINDDFIKRSIAELNIRMNSVSYDFGIDPGVQDGGTRKSRKSRKSKKSKKSKKSRK